MVDHQSDLRDLITLTPEEIAEANAWFDEVALQAEISEVSQQQNTTN
jgi:hypothetical protein